MFYISQTPSKIPYTKTRNRTTVYEDSQPFRPKNAKLVPVILRTDDELDFLLNSCQMVLKKNFHQKDCLLEHVYKRIQTTADKTVSIAICLTIKSKSSYYSDNYNWSLDLVLVVD